VSNEELEGMIKLNASPKVAQWLLADTSSMAAENLALTAETLAVHSRNQYPFRGEGRKVAVYGDELQSHQTPAMPGDS
jgi:hypothetical protein